MKGAIRKLFEEKCEPVNAIDGVRDGQAAARHIVTEVMKKVFETLPPAEIVEAFVADPEALWDVVGDRTNELLVLATQTLAQLWECAWAAGEGDKHFNDADLSQPCNPQTLMAICRKKDDFIPARSIEEISGELHKLVPA